MFEQFTPVLGRPVWVREDTSDMQVHADTFAARYHLPPEDFPVPARVLDLGSNVGYTVAHYQALWPDAEIVAVEMDEDCCQMIELNAPGARVLNHPVAGVAGWGNYNPNVRAEAYQFTPRDGILAADDPRRPVFALTMRETMRLAFGEQTVDFVKCDTESAEWGIFEHGEDWAPIVNSILVELHPDNDHPDDTRSLVATGIEALQALGFEARHHPPHPRAVWGWKP